MQLNVEELQKKYGLSFDEIRDEIERVISDVLTLRLGFEVEAVFNERHDVIDIYKYSSDISSIQFESIKKSLIRDIKYSIVNRLLLKSVLKDYEVLKGLIQTIVYGTVKKGCGLGSLYISIQNIDGKENVVGVCGIESQTPKERGRLEGMTLPFYVLNVQPVYEQAMPKIDIKLSRNSKRFPERLLKEELFNKNIDIKVECVKRIAGAFSLIHVPERIPKECIKKVSDELKERIIVKWGKNV